MGWLAPLVLVEACLLPQYDTNRGARGDGGNGAVAGSRNGAAESGTGGAAGSLNPGGGSNQGGTPASTGGSLDSGGDAPTESGGGGGGGGIGAAPSGGGEGGEGGDSSHGDVWGHPNPGKTYPEYPGFKLQLVEEFDAPLDLSTDPIWTYSDGGVDEGQVRYTKESITFGPGVMRITVSQNPAPSSVSFADNKTIPAKPLRSGELRTRHNNFRYGRYEARFKAPRPTPTPGQAGNLIANLFVHRTPRGEEWREIGIEVTGDSPSALTTILFYANNTPAWHPDIQEAFPLTSPGLDSQADYNEYAIEWTPASVKWFLNGVLIREKLAGGGLPIPERSTKIMMSLWIFNNTGYGGTGLANNVYPMTVEYDWFRFYKLESDTEYPCEGFPSCLPADDLNLSKNNPEEP